MKTSDEEGCREKRREIPSGVLGRFMLALAGSLAPRIYIYPSLVLAEGWGCGWRGRGEVIFRLFPTDLYSPAPAGQRILQDIIRYAPKVDRWLLRSAKTSVPRHRENSLPQDSSLPTCDFSTEKTTPASRRRRRRHPNVRNNFRFSWWATLFRKPARGSIFPHVEGTLLKILKGVRFI